MNKDNKDARKCKICGKTIVGRNKTGICSACKKKAGDTGVAVLNVLGVIGTTALVLVKSFTEKD